MDKAIDEAKMYTNMQDLGQLRADYRAHPEEVKLEVAKQFESMLMQMVMHSMREANDAFASDLFGSDTLDTYQDMFDKQISLMTDRNGVGFTDSLKKHIDEQEAAQRHPEVKSLAQVHRVSSKSVMPLPLPIPHHQQNSSASLIPLDIKPKLPDTTVTATTPHESFIQKMLPFAKQAAQMIGINPALLLAQAALETHWGTQVIKNTDNSSSHNLFNIKSDTSWKDKSVAVDTLEQQNGLVVKVKSQFRSYDSYYNSFMDYVNFLRGNSRYSHALENATHPDMYMNALQQAGFATDGEYAKKVLKIFNSDHFKSLIAKFNMT